MASVKRVLGDAPAAVFPLFSAKKSCREISTGVWSKYKGTLLVGEFGSLAPSSKIAAFDLVCLNLARVILFEHENTKLIPRSKSLGRDYHMHEVREAFSC